MSQNVKEKTKAIQGFPHWFAHGVEDLSHRESYENWPKAKEEFWRRSELKRLPLDRLYKGKQEIASAIAPSPADFQLPQASDQRLRLTPLNKAIELDYPGVRELLQPSLKEVENRFQARLFSQLTRGFYFYLPKNYRPEDILFLEDRVSGDQEESFCLNLVVLEEGAQAELWERISQADEGAVVHNRATLFLLQAGAELTYYRTQSLGQDSSLVDFSKAVLHRDSRFYSYQAESELNFNKSHLKAELKESGAQAELRGIYSLKDHGFQEIFTQQVHEAPHCVSHSIFRGVLDGKSRAVYNGMIQVKKDGRKTDAYLTNNHLLLGDHCRADSIPGLKIETNDVKCSHGSTSGKIQPDQIFYLQSRGFSQEEAKAMITQAFLEEMFQEAHPMVKKELQHHWGLSWEEV